MEVRRLSPGAKVFGLDISPANARSTLARGIPAGVSSAECLPFPDGCFDVVFFMEVYEHLPRRDEALAEIRRVLKVDGTLVMSVPNRWTAPRTRLNAGRQPSTVASVSSRGGRPNW